MVRVVPVQEAKGSIVDSEPHNAHVVSVEHAMAKANTLPFSNHPCCSLCHLSEKGRVPLYVVRVTGMGSLDLRVERADDIVKQLDSDIISSHAGACTPCVLIRRLKNFKGAESYESGSYTQHNRALFIFWITIIEHVSHHCRLRRDAGPGPRGGDSQVKHGFAAQELTDA